MNKVIASGLLIVATTACKQSTETALPAARMSDSTAVVQRYNSDVVLVAAYSAIKFGSEKMQLRMTYSATGSEADVLWTVTAPEGKAPGTVSNSGLYISPPAGDSDYAVTVTGTLRSDSSVKRSATFMVNRSQTVASNSILVTLPAPSIRIGSQRMTPVVRSMGDASIPDVIWSIKGPAETDLGNMTTDGVYISPVTAKNNFAIQIVATLKSDKTVSSSSSLIVETSATAVITLTSPVTELKAGRQQVALVAKNNTVVLDNKQFRWTVTAAAGLDAGTIDQLGVYTSPASATAAYTVDITAALLDNSLETKKLQLTIQPQTTLSINGVSSQVCTAGNTAFPVLTHIAKIPTSTFQMPKFNTLTRVSTFCMSKIAFPTQEFKGGFPGADTLIDWFTLQSTARLVIPTNGDYFFRLDSDDGSMLYIDDKIVVNNDGKHGALIKEGKVWLGAGTHTLRSEYFQGERFTMKYELSWKKPGDSAFSIIPTASFAP